MNIPNGESAALVLELLPSISLREGVMLVRYILASSAVGVTSIYLYARHLHRTLSTRVNHTVVSAERRKAAHASDEIQCLPVELLEQPQNFRIIHVQDEKAGPVKVPLDDKQAAELFTKLLRWNMIAFSTRTPQCYILRLMAKTPEQKASFAAEHISALHFHHGDLFCGFNRVLKRDPLKCEVQLVPAEGMGNFSGRLVISLQRKGDGVVLTTQTLQWTGAKDRTVLPLERGVANFMHECASWWLIVSGLRYLEQLSPA